MNNIANWFMSVLFIIFIIGVIGYTRYEYYIYSSKYGVVKSLLFGLLLVACLIGFFKLLFSPYSYIIPAAVIIILAIMAACRVGEVLRRKE